MNAHLKEEESLLIPLYGGKLVDLLAAPAEVEQLEAYGVRLPSVQAGSDT